MKEEITLKALLNRKCVPCEGSTNALSKEEYTPLLTLIKCWQVKDDKELSKTLNFSDFKHAIAMINEIAYIAEEEGHHPDLSLFGWNKLRITLSTHAIKGLSENDFILGAKIDELMTDDYFDEKPVEEK